MRDFLNVESVGIQINHDAQRIWVCINGECVLRVKGIKVLILTNDTDPSGSGEVHPYHDPHPPEAA